MDLLEDIHETPIYKIKVWKSQNDNECHTFIFVGKESKQHKFIKAILDKLQNSEVINATEEQVLIDTYGQNAKNKLGFNIKNKTYVFETLYYDDNINALLKKASVYLFNNTVDENDMFCWIKKEVHPSFVFYHALAVQLLRGKGDMSSASLHESLKAYLNCQDATNLIATKSKYGYDDMIALLKKVKITSVNEVLGFKYLQNQYLKFVETNPFKNMKVDDVNKYEVVTDRSLTLEHYKIKDNTIHMTLYDYVYQYDKNVVSFYFPFHTAQKKEISNDIFKTSDVIQQEIVDKHQSLRPDDFNITHRISYLHMRLNEKYTGKEIDLKYVFKKFEPTQEVPFIKYNTSVNKEYKVLKESFSTKAKYQISKSDFENWIDLNPKEGKKQSLQEYLVFKVFLKNVMGKSKFVSVIVFPDVHIDIKYMLKASEDVTDKDIINSFKHINNLFDGVQSIVEADLLIPRVEKNFWMKPEAFSDISIVNMSSHVNILCTKATAKLEDIRRLASSMLPVFNVVELDEKHYNSSKVLFLNYLRIDNFQKTDNVIFFLNQNINMELDSKITALEQMFKLSHDQALEEYEKWKQVQKVELIPIGRGIFFKPANANMVTIKIQPASLGFNVMIDGVTRTKYHKRILNFLRFLTYYAASNKVKSVSFLKSFNPNDRQQYDAIFKEDNRANEVVINDVFNDEIDIHEHFAKGHDEIELEGNAELDDVWNLDDFDLDDALKKIENKEEKDNPGQELLQGDDDIIYDEEEQINKLKDNKKDNKFQYVLNKLKAADKALFTGTDYSKRCQWVNKRQPIVVSREDFKKLNPSSYDNNYVAFGSDDEKMQKNIYICPEIWCPISRVSMTYEQYVKAGKKCPAKDIEEPVIDMGDGYWNNKKDGSKRTSRYVSFLGTGKECLPCCFKIPPKNDNKNQRNIKECTQPKTVKKSIVPSIKEDKNLDKYIVGLQYPLDSNRYGILPKQVSALLNETTCGTGQIVTGTNCYVRRGINHENNSSFLSCLSHIFNLDTQDIVTSVREHLPIETFLLTNNGALCSMFINESRSIYDPKEFKAFRKWFLQNEEEDKKVFRYKAKFDLGDIQKDIAEHASEAFTKQSQGNYSNFKHILREYLVYNAYTNFLEYLGDNSVEKNFELLINLFNRDTEWLNTMGYNIIVFETDKEEAFISCPFDQSQSLNMSRPFVFIIKQENTYEPVYKVESPEGGSFKSYFALSYSKDARVKHIVDTYKSNCKDKSQPTDAKTIYSILMSLGQGVKYQVINYNYKLEGLITKKGVFVPCIPQNPLMTPGSWYIYTDGIVEKVKHTEWAGLKTLFSELYAMTNNDLYKIKQKVMDEQDDNRIVALITESGVTIPVDKKAFPTELYLDNLNIFIGETEEDARTLFIDSIEKKQLIFEIIKNEILNVVFKNKHLQDDLDFLQADDNPLPKSFKKARLETLISKYIAKIIKKVDELPDDITYSKCSGLRKSKCKGMCTMEDGRCVLKVPSEWVDIFQSKLAELILNKNAHKTDINMKLQRSKGASSLVFDQQKVIEGKASQLFDVLQNPYTLASSAVGNYIQEILDKNVKVKPLKSIQELLSDNWRTLPIKFNKVFNGKQDYDFTEEMATGFGINEQTARKNFLFDLFYMVNKTLNTGIKLNEDNIKKVIENRLIKDYKQNKDVTIEYLKLHNPSFAQLSKRKRDLSIQDLIDFFNDEAYFPSEYELETFAELLKIKIILVGRKTSRHGQEIVCIKPKHVTKTYIMLHQEIQKDYDLYNIIVKDRQNKQIIFHNEDNPVISEYINKSCVKWFFVDMNVAERHV